MNTGLTPEVLALYYYLYRQAGCPLGDNLSGLQGWMKIQIEVPFINFCDKAYPAEESKKE